MGGRQCMYTCIWLILCIAETNKAIIPPIKKKKSVCTDRKFLLNHLLKYVDQSYFPRHQDQRGQPSPSTHLLGWASRSGGPQAEREGYRHPQPPPWLLSLWAAPAALLCNANQLQNPNPAHSEATSRVTGWEILSQNNWIEAGQGRAGVP